MLPLAAFVVLVVGGDVVVPGDVVPVVVGAVVVVVGGAVAFSVYLGPDERHAGVSLDDGRIALRLTERGRALHLDVDDVGPLLVGPVDTLEAVQCLEVARTDLEQPTPSVRSPKSGPKSHSIRARC